MFNIDKTPMFWSKVRIALPGEPEEHFDAHFIVQPVAKAKEVMNGTPEALATFIDAALADTADIYGDDEKPFRFSEVLKARLLAMPHVRTALLIAYGEGLAAARSGN